METSYLKEGGSGDRSSLITVAYSDALGAAVGGVGSLVNGLKYPPEVYHWAMSGLILVAGEWCKFSFLSKKLIDEAKFYMSDACNHGTWKWQGSNDGVIWVDIGGGFLLGNNQTVSTQTELNGNIAGYQHYRILGISGNVNTNTYVNEFEFKIDDYVDDSPVVNIPDSPVGYIRYMTEIDKRRRWRRLSG